MLIIEKLQSASNLTDNEQAIGEYIFSLGWEMRVYPPGFLPRRFIPRRQLSSAFVRNWGLKASMS